MNASPPQSWQSLLSGIHTQLQASASACGCAQGAQNEEKTPASPLMRDRLRQCLASLAQLQPLLDREFERLHQMERLALEAQAALTLARAELACTQDGERRARHLALHDALTALPNRRFFIERLTHATAILEQGEPARLAVIYLDLDDFKPVNDAYGHDIGDEMLKVVARRLDRRVRSEDMVSRLGGDEFACLRCGPVSQPELSRLARKLYETIAAPMQIGHLRLRVRPSIGIAVHPADGSTAATLMRSADSAMYAAKRQRVGHAFCAKDGEVREDAGHVVAPALKRDPSDRAASALSA